MSSRRRIPRSRRSGASFGTGKRVLAISGAAAIAIALVAALIYANQMERDLAAIDPETFCPNAGPTDVLAVLVDRTDGLTEVQAESLSRRLMAWGGEVPTGGKFTVYEVGKGGRLLEPLVSVCNPGDGGNASQWTSNPEMLREQYEEKYSKPIAAMTEEMRTDAEADSSPIFEAIQAVSVKEFGPDHKSLKNRRLILVTDLLQHGSGFSLYKSVPDYQTFRKTPYAGSVRSDLKGVSTYIHLLHRLNAAGKQTDDLANFWVRWLEDQGAIVEVFTRVPG
jgi:hypothetical protein